MRTWYEEHGEGEALVLLHPGGADARAWGPALGPLAERFHVYTPERRGQGRTADVEGPISYELMAADTVAFLEEVVGGPAHLVGYSAGAVVAPLVALRGDRARLRAALTRRARPLPGGPRQAGADELRGADPRRRRAGRGEEPDPGDGW
jgi:pimeloyl-ACP methyl ester carboxylesterase